MIALKGKINRLSYKPTDMSAREKKLAFVAPTVRAGCMGARGLERPLGRLAGCLRGHRHTGLGMWVCWFGLAGIVPCLVPLRPCGPRWLAICHGIARASPVCTQALGSKAQPGARQIVERRHGAVGWLATDACHRQPRCGCALSLTKAVVRIPGCPSPAAQHGVLEVPSIAFSDT